MKAFLYIVVLLFLQTRLLAQDDSIRRRTAHPTMRHLVSGGIGFSHVQYVYTQAEVLIEQPSLKRVPINSNFQPHSSVVVNADYDFRLFNHFSLGPAYSHQSYRFDFDRCYSGDSLMHGDFSDRAVMHNIGLKTLFHLSGPDEKGGIYGGARWSFVKWIFHSESRQRYTAVKFFRDGFRAQGIIGYRLFFSRHFGLTLETAFGPPFFGQLGLNARF